MQVQMNNGRGVGAAGGSRNQNPLNYVNNQQPSTINHLAIGGKVLVGNSNFDSNSLDRVQNQIVQNVVVSQEQPIGNVQLKRIRQST